MSAATVPICPEKREITPSDIVPQFLLFKRATGISPRTLEDYQRTLDLLFTRYPAALDKPRESTLSFLAGYDNAYSFNVYFAYLKNFWDWTLSEGYFRGGVHPLHGLKKRRTQGRIVQLEEKEVSALLRTPDQKTYCGLRDYALMLLSLDCGIRPGEALQLVPGDIALEKEELSVRAEIAKTRVPRVLPLSGPTLGTIKKLIHVRPVEWIDAPVFCTETGEPWSVTSWSRRVKSYGKKCGLDITAYALRHTAALLMLRHGMDAFALQRVMGHSTMDMTRHYINLTSEDTRKAHKQAGVVLALVKEEEPPEGKPKKKRLRGISL
jgi:integrase